MEEKNINIKKDNGRIFFNDEETDIVLIYVYNKGETKELTIWKKEIYTNDIDRCVLDILYSLQMLLTRDNRNEFLKFNKKVNKLFYNVTRKLTEYFIERQEATRTDIHLENNQE